MISRPSSRHLPVVSSARCHHPLPPHLLSLSLASPLSIPQVEQPGTPTRADRELSPLPQSNKISAPIPSFFSFFFFALLFRVFVFLNPMRIDRFPKLESVSVRVSGFLVSSVVAFWSALFLFRCRFDRLFYIVSVGQG